MSRRGGAGRQRRERGLGGEQVEGRRAVRELLIAGRRRVREILVQDDLTGRDQVAEILQLASEERVPVREVSRNRLRSLARTEAPQGIVARAAPLREVPLEDLLAARSNGPEPFLVAFDGVTDPGNLGAALRSAECAGVTGVLLARHRAVHVTPAVTKAAAGAVEHLPVAVVAGMPSALSRLREHGTWIVGLDPAGDPTIHDLDLSRSPVVLVVGSEGGGLSRLVRQRCDVLARIPLAGQLASLNVAAAATLACYEVRRQRDAGAVRNDPRGAE